MKRTMKLILTAALIFSSMLVTAISAQAGSIENLERERANLIGTFLNPSLTPVERQNKVEAAKTRLVDLERMVLRDDSLKGRNTPNVRKAFANYDLTFLVHASTEKNQSMFDHWLEQIGLSTEVIMGARKGRR